MNCNGTIRELEENEAPMRDEIAIDNALLAEVRRLTVNQRQRFYKMVRYGNSQDAALMRAKSRP